MLDDCQQGPLWQESFLGKPLNEFSKREVFQVISNEMARDFARATELDRALHELARFSIFLSVQALDESTQL
jgi:regulator of sirC expression with transglutaminase-like and TPR domain